MGVYKNTKEVTRDAGVQHKISNRKAKGAAKVGLFMSGKDKWGHENTSGKKVAGKLLAVVNPTASLQFAKAKQFTKGHAGGMKARSDINRAQVESLKNKLDVTLTVLSFGGYGAAVAGVKGAVTGAKAASAINKTSTGVSALGKAANVVKGGVKGYKAGTTAFKAAQTGTQVAGAVSQAGDVYTKLAKMPKGLAEFEKAADLAESGVKAAESANKVLNTSSKTSQFATNLANKVGSTFGQDSKLLQDFIKGVGSKGDQKFGQFAKEFYKTNKKAIKEKGIEWAKKGVNEAYAKYDEQFAKEDEGIAIYKKGGLVSKYMKKGGKTDPPNKNPKNDLIKELKSGLDTLSTGIKDRTYRLKDGSIKTMPSPMESSLVDNLKEEGIKMIKNNPEGAKKAMAHPAYERLMKYIKDNPGELNSFFSELGVDPNKGLDQQKISDISPSAIRKFMRSAGVTKDEAVEVMDAGGLPWWKQQVAKPFLAKGNKVQGMVVGESHEGPNKGVDIKAEGGERVISVADTKKLDKLKASGNKTALGAAYAKIVDKHNRTPTEYIGGQTYAGGGVKTGTTGASVGNTGVDVYSSFKAGIHAIESSKDGYNAQNSTSSAVGKYQFIWDGTKTWGGWKQQIMDSTGVKSKEEFLNNPEAQEKFMNEYIETTLIPEAKKLREMYPEETKSYSDEELMAMDHFQGLSNTSKFLKTGKTANAKNNVTVQKYLSIFNEGFTGGGGEHNTTVELKFEEEGDQEKYEKWKGGQKYSIPELQLLDNAVKEYNSGKKDLQVSTSKTSRQLDIEKNKHAKLKTAWEEGDDVLAVGYTSRKDMAVDLAETEKNILEKQFELIDAETKTVNDVRKNIIPKIDIALLKIEQAYDNGDVDKREYEWNTNKIEEYKKGVDEYVKRADRAKAYKDDIGQKVLEHKTKILTSAKEAQKSNIELGTAGGFEYIWHSGSPSDAIKGLEKELSKDQLEAYDKQREVIEADALARDEERKTFEEFEYEDLDAGLDLSVGLNYSEEDAKVFESREKKYKQDAIAKQKLSRFEAGENQSIYDSDTEQNLDVATMSDDAVKKYLKGRDTQLETTGLKKIYNKYGGMDTMLQMGGMIAAYKSATAPLPEQRASDSWLENMAQLKDRASLGLDESTKTLYQRNAERTYATDVSSIGRMASSANSALGALGSASSRKYQADMTMASEDSRLREVHQQQYSSALAVDEEKKQAMWERNVYEPAERKVVLKSAIIGKAISNMRETVLENKQYGDGSLYDQLMKDSIESKEVSTESLKRSELKEMGATKEQINKANEEISLENKQSANKKTGLRALFQ